MHPYFGSEYAQSPRRERPICVALIVCNEVIEDKRTGNKTLVGLFNGILAPQLPALHGRFFVMASLTSGGGQWRFSFRITAPSGKSVLHVEENTHFADPLIGHDLVVEVRNLPLEEAGVHFLDFYLDDSPVAHRRFTVAVGAEAAI